MIEAAVSKALQARPVPAASSRPRSLDPAREVSLSDDDGPSTSSGGKFISREERWDILAHVRDNLGFPPFQLEADGNLFPQYASPSRLGMPFQGPVKDMVLREWREVDKLQVPRFLQKLYLLEGEDPLPHNLKLDSILATLIGKTAIQPEDCTPADATDKKVDSGLKRSFAAGNLALRASLFSAYSAQSLVQDFEKLAAAVQEGSECSDLLAAMEQQARLLADISSDVIKSSAMSTGALVAARRSLWLRSWKADPGEKAALLKLPFDGLALFGDQLPAMISKAFKERKHALPYKGGAAPSGKPWSRAPRSSPKRDSRQSFRRRRFQPRFSPRHAASAPKGPAKKGP